VEEYYEGLYVNDEDEDEEPPPLRSEVATASQKAQDQTKFLQSYLGRVETPCWTECITVGNSRMAK